jgi:hypothetical protein
MLDSGKKIERTVTVKNKPLLEPTKDSTNKTRKKASVYTLKMVQGWKSHGEMTRNMEGAN